LTEPIFVPRKRRLLLCPPRRAKSARLSPVPWRVCSACGGSVRPAKNRRRSFSCLCLVRSTKEARCSTTTPVLSRTGLTKTAAQNMLPSLRRKLISKSISALLANATSTCASALGSVGRAIRKSKLWPSTSSRSYLPALSIPVSTVCVARWGRNRSGFRSIRAAPRPGARASAAWKPGRVGVCRIKDGLLKVLGVANEFRPARSAYAPFRTADRIHR
jgi:hypothetical protein